METESKKQSRSKLDLLTAVENIVDLSKDSQLSPEFYHKASRYIKHLSTRLDLTKEQSVMLALFIDQSDDCNIYASDIVKATGCRTTRVIRYTNDIDVLVNRGLIIRKRATDRVSYRVPLEVVDAFKVNEVFAPRKMSGLTCRELFNELAIIVDMVEDDEMDYKSARERFVMLLESNQHLLFVQALKIHCPNRYMQDDLILLLMFCHLFVNKHDDMVGFHDIDCMFSKSEMRSIRSELERGENELQNMKLVEFSNSNGMGDRYYFRLTMKAKRELLDELQLASLEASKSLSLQTSNLARYSIRRK